jgi:hypothetical protein
VSISVFRGYLGYSIQDSWYGWPPRKEAVRQYKYPTGNYGAREWPIGWIGIDGDEIIEHELEPVLVEEEPAEKNEDGGFKRNVSHLSLLNEVNYSLIIQFIHLLCSSLLNPSFRRKLASGN